MRIPHESAVIKTTVIDGLNCCLVDRWATICTVQSMVPSETKGFFSLKMEGYYEARFQNKGN